MPEAKRLKQLEDENAKLKKLLAEQMWMPPRSRASVKKMVGPAVKREGVAHLGPRWACGTAGLPIVSADRKMAVPLMGPPDAGSDAMRDLANERKRFGYRRLSSCAAGGRALGHNRITGFIAKKASRCASGRLGGAPWVAGADPKGQAERSLAVDVQTNCLRPATPHPNIVDDVTRECLAAIPDTSISGRRG